MVKPFLLNQIKTSQKNLWETKEVLGLWVLSKLLFLLILTTTQLFDLSVTEPLKLWDAKWYLTIATKGYEFTTNLNQSPTAFPPLYPLLGRIFTLLTKNYLWSLMIISNLSSLFGTVFLYKLIKHHYKHTLAIKGTALILFSPVGWIFSLAYTESLFLLLSIRFFLLLLKNKLNLSTAVLALLPITRILGLLYLIPLFISFYKSKTRIQRSLYLTILSTSGFLAWIIYIWAKFHNPLIIITSQTDWHRTPTPFPLMISYQLLYLWNLIPESLNISNFINWLLISLPYLIDSILIITIVSITLIHIKKIPNIYRLFTVLYLL